MSNTSKDRSRDEGATPPTSRAVKLALVGVCLFVGGLLLPGVDMGFESFILAFLFMPFMMAAGLGMAIYWSIVAWRRPTLSGQDLAPESSRSIAELIAEGDVARDSPAVPEAEKQGGVSLLLVGVIILCCMHMAFIRGIHVRPGEGDILGLGPAFAAMAGAAFAALVAGLVASLLRSFGHVKKVQTVAAVLVLCSLAVQAWHALKRAEEHAQMRLAYGLDEPLPPPMDFRIHIENHKWSELEPHVPEIDIDGQDWSIRYTYKDHIWRVPPTEECTGTMNPREAADLFAVLEAIRERIRVGQPLCADLPGGNLKFSLSYAGADGDWSWDANVDCVLRPADDDQIDWEARRLSQLIFDLAPVWEGEERVTCKYLITPEAAQRAAEKLGRRNPGP